jgi:putative transposase
MKNRFTQEQTIRSPQEGERADSIREACRRHHLTEQKCYRWRNIYGGMDVSEVKALRELEGENRAEENRG